jgi:hypothetical protein
MMGVWSGNGRGEREKTDEKMVGELRFLVSQAGSGCHWLVAAVQTTVFSVYYEDREKLLLLPSLAF